MTAQIFHCLICKTEYVFEDHHHCLDTCIIQPEERLPSRYRPSRRSYYREYMRKRRAERKTCNA